MFQRSGAWRRGSIILITLVVFGLILWDVFAYLFGGIEGTLSDVVLAWAWQKPLLPFVFGVLMGHLFWPQKRPLEPKEMSEADVWRLAKHFNMPLLGIHRRIMRGDSVGPFEIEDIGVHE